MKKTFALLLMVLLLMCSVLPAFAQSAEPVKIKVLILPKFESGEMAGDFPGEAQYYYEGYCQGGDEYEIKGGFADNKLYVKDGVALYVTGMGKVNTALSLTAVLMDERFDFSDAYILSTGCAGSAYEYGVMGDVFVITAAIDYDLGHHADVRELPEGSVTTWFHDKGYDSSSCKILNQDLMDRVYSLVKDVKVETTDRTRAFMAAAFDNAEWATRDPMVLRGTTVSGDNYWKGAYDHANAVLMTETYQCPDPFALTRDGGRGAGCGGRTPGHAGSLYHHPRFRQHGRVHERRVPRQPVGSGFQAIPGLRVERGSRRYLCHRDGKQL